MSKLKTIPSTFASTKPNEVDNNNAEKESNKYNKGLVSKKSLVRLTNREGSTRSLSCFKNPEMSSKDLPLSEEMTVNMYNTNFESNTGLTDKAPTKSNKQVIDHLETVEVERVDGRRSGKLANNNRNVVSNESFSTRTLKLSEAFDGNNNVNGTTTDENGNSTENFKRKWNGVNIEERSNKDFKRTNAFDSKSQSNSTELAEVKLSNMLKHRENESFSTRTLKLSEAFDGNNNENGNTTDENGNSTENFKRKWNGANIEERSNKDFKRTNAFDSKSQSNSTALAEVKLSNMLKHREKVASIAAQESKERNGTDNEIDPKMNEDQVLQVRQRKFESKTEKGKYVFNSSSENGVSQHSKISSRNETELGHNSFKQTRDQRDSFDNVQDQKSQSNVIKHEFVQKQKQALEMKKSPPLNTEWKENVHVPLWRSNSGETDDSNSIVTTEIKESRVEKISSHRQMYDVDDVSNFQNGDYRQDLKVKRGCSWDTDDNNDYDVVVTSNENKYDNEPIIKGNVGERKEFFSSLDKRSGSQYEGRDRQIYDRTTKPKHLEFFENIDKDQHRHKNMRGRTEANRQKIGKRVLPDIKVNDDLKESLKHIYSKPSTQQKLFTKQNYSRNLNENGDQDHVERGRIAADKHLYTNDSANVPNSKTSRNYVDVVTSRSVGRNFAEVNGGDSPVSDALSDDKESGGEYELMPRSGRSQVPSDDQIQRMIEDNENNRRTQNSNIPADRMNSDYIESSTFKPDVDNFYEELDELNNAVNKERQKYDKKPRGPGPSYDRIWMEEENRQRARGEPTNPRPDMDVYDDNDDDDEEEFSEDNEETYDDVINKTQQEASVKTITKTITRKIKQTIPSGIVTIAPEEKNNRKVDDNRMTGTIISFKEKPRQTLEKTSVSGFINVDKEIPKPSRMAPRKEQNIEIVTKNNPVVHETRSFSSFDNRNYTPQPSHIYRHESLSDNYNERMITTPIAETELGIDAELRDAQKTGNTYRITMNLTPSLLVTSRPPSAMPMPNSSFVSPPFSPTSFISQHNPISRHNSNNSSDLQTRHMNGYGTLSSVAPSVFSPPIHPPSYKPNILTHLDHNKNNGSGKVVVSLNGTKNNNPYPQDDIAFNLSLRGAENKPMSTSSTGLLVSQIKSSPGRNDDFGEEIIEKVETTITSEPMETSGTTRRNKSSVNTRSSSPRRLVPEQSEKNVVRTSRSEQRHIIEGGRSKSQSSRPEILYSALDEQDTFDGLSSYEFPKKTQNSEVKLSRNLEWRRREIKEPNVMVKQRSNGLPPIAKTTLQSLDENGNYDREIEVNKRYFGNYGNTGNSLRTNVESREIHESIGSVSSERRMEQINKFEIQTLLQGAAADSIKQRINVKRLGDKLSNGPKISEEMKESMTRDELLPSEDDKVAEEISMHIDNGKVTMTSEILCQKTVPIYNSQDMYKTSSVLLIRIIEVDLSVTPERKKLYELLVGPNIEKRPLSDNEKKELYKKFMTLAEHSRKGLF